MDDYEEFRNFLSHKVYASSKIIATDGKSLLIAAAIVACAVACLFLFLSLAS